MEVEEDDSVYPSKSDDKKLPRTKKTSKTLSNNASSKKGRKESKETVTCEICNKEYKNIRNLDKHRKIHLNNHEETFEKKINQQRTSQRKCIGKTKKSGMEDTFSALKNSGIKLSLRKRQVGWSKRKTEKIQVGWSKRKTEKRQEESKREILSDDNFAKKDNDPDYKGQIEAEENKGCENENRKLKCTVCYKKFPSAVKLNIHKRIHNEEKPFSCNLCPKSFRRHDHLKIHVKRHSAAKKFVCDICGEGFKRQDHLRYHKVNNHEGTIYLNELKVFNKTQKVQSERTVLCEVCGKGFVDQNRLRVHRKIHAEVKKFQCEFCPKSFSYSSNYNVHLRLHTGNNPYKCVVCGEAFRTSSRLKTHSRKHTGEYPFMCEVCGMLCGEKDLLKTHMQTHRTKPKLHECTHCGKSFAHNSTLRSHIRLHTGAKPYQCQICGHSFAQLSSLNYHKRTHTGEKPFTCHICGTSFTRKTTLTSHLQRHAGTKTVSCSSCDFTCYTSRQLRKHIAAHHTPASAQSIKQAGAAENRANGQMSNSFNDLPQQIPGENKKIDHTLNVLSSLPCFIPLEAAHHSQAHINLTTGSNALVGSSMSNYTPVINESVLDHNSDGSLLHHNGNLQVQIPGLSSEKSDRIPSPPPSTVAGFVPLNSAANHQPQINTTTTGDSGVTTVTMPNYNSVLSEAVKMSNGNISNVDPLCYNLIQGYPQSSYTVQMPSHSQHLSLHHLSQTLEDSIVNPSPPVIETNRAVSTNQRSISSSTLPPPPPSLYDSDPSQSFNPLSHSPQVDHNINIPNHPNTNFPGNNPDTLPPQESQPLSSSLHFQSISLPINTTTETVPASAYSCNQMSSPVIIPINPGIISRSTVTVTGSERISGGNSQRENIWLKIGTSSKNFPSQTHKKLEDSLPVESTEHPVAENLAYLPSNPCETAEEFEMPADHPGHTDGQTGNMVRICPSPPPTDDVDENDSARDNISTINHPQSTSGQPEFAGNVTSDTLNSEGMVQAINSLHHNVTTDKGVNSFEFDSSSSLVKELNLRKDSKPKETVEASTFSQSKDESQNHKLLDLAEEEKVVHDQEETQSAEDKINSEVAEDGQLSSADVVKPKRSRDNQRTAKKQTKASKSKSLVVKLRIPLTRSKLKEQLKAAEGYGSKNNTAKKNSKIKTKTTKKIGKLVLKIGKEKQKINDNENKEKGHVELKPKTYSCSKCDESFSRAGLLAMHKQNFHKKKEHECHECGSHFLRIQQLKKHTSKCHSKPKRLTCLYCLQVMFSKDLMMEHMKSEHEGQNPFSCNACNLQFLNVDDLKHHIKSNHYDIDYKCHICNETFEKSKFLKDHMSSRHKCSKAFICQPCNKSFAECSLLVLHNKHKHAGMKPYKCNLCSKVFAAAAKLQNHLRAHTGDKPFTCEYCGKVFAHLSLLSIHVKAHSSEKPFVCTQCNQAFTHKSTLIAHIRTHTGAKPFECDLCGKAFAQLASLNYHRKSHDGLKPFTCDMCGKSFTRSTTLKTHLMQHDGKKRFSCELCDFKCNRKHALRKHHSKKHSEPTKVAEKVMVLHPEHVETATTKLTHVIQTQPPVEINGQILEKGTNNLYNSNTNADLQYRELQPAISASLSPYLHLAIPNSPLQQLQLPQQQNNLLHQHQQQQQQQQHQQQQFDLKQPVQPVSMYVSEQKEFYSAPIQAPFFYPMSSQQPQSEQQLHTVEVPASSPSPPPHTITMLGQGTSGMPSFPISLQTLHPFHHPSNSNNN